MTRSQVVLRPAALADAPFLVDLWQESCRRVDRSDQVADLEAAIKTADESPEQRLLVAEYAGEQAGAVLLRLTALSPINPEPCVLVLSPTVSPSARRKGIGRMLMEAAVTFGDELGVAHLATAVDSGSRDANRFMARLGLGPKATLRLAPIATVQSKVAGPAGRAPAARPLGQILAARRSMRRPAVTPSSFTATPPAEPSS